MNIKCYININILEWSTACYVLLVQEKKETKERTISQCTLFFPFWQN